MGLKQKHKKFNESRRKHILIITNHGCHSPVIEVTTDTGGQNFYVNDFAKALLKLGYKVTILNRGGYKHPTTNVLHKGIIYYDNIWKRNGIYCRIIYLEDGYNQFIQKEILTLKGLKKEKDFFFKQAKKIGLDLKKIYFISSHYWDAGILGIKINEELKTKKPHIWTPHSLGILKKKNYKNASKDIVKALNFPYRIENEKTIISGVDGVVSTSSKIKNTLSEYKLRIKSHYWFPPGIDTDVFKPRLLRQCKGAFTLIKNYLKMTKKDTINYLTTKTIFFEVSRTAKPKQKDMVLRSFAKIKNKENALLIMTIDQETELYNKILESYNKLRKKNSIILIDQFIEEKAISELFSLVDIYITPSLMEGWGMSVQEAAASKCAIISSKFVPFVTEVLKDNALIVHKNYPRLYAEKMDILMQEDHLRKRLANKCYKIITNHYSWSRLSIKLILKMKKRGLIS